MGIRHNRIRKRLRPVHSCAPIPIRRSLDTAARSLPNVPNVILAGTLFYRPSYYEALARLVADRRPAQGAIDDATFDDVMLGEHRHLILQALCRGSVRRCQGDVCAPCNAYIIATTRSGIPAALR